VVARQATSAFPDGLPRSYEATELAGGRRPPLPPRERCWSHDENHLPKLRSRFRDRRHHEYQVPALPEGGQDRPEQSARRSLDRR
jgi:hypothetical protein